MADSIRTMAKVSVALGLAAFLAAADAHGQSLAVPLAATSPLEVTMNGPKEAFVGQAVTMEVVIRNTGKEITPPFKMDFRHSSNFFDAIPMDIHALAPQESQSLNVTFTRKRSGVANVGILAEEVRDEPAVDGVKFYTLSCKAQVKFSYDPKTPVRKLLPEPPRFGAEQPKLAGALAEVPEVCLEHPMDPSNSGSQVRDHIAETIEKICHLNQRKHDGFVRGLTSERADLAGLPFIMGDACRLNKERRAQFGEAVDRLRGGRGRLNPAFPASESSGGIVTPPLAPYDAPYFAAMLQISGAHDSSALVEYLKTPSSPQAFAASAEMTRGLARLAIFSDVRAVREAALAALRSGPVESAKECADVLVQGLDYPWPDVARRAGDAIARLKLEALVPKLIEVLERPDPRAPREEKLHGKNVTVVRELVRLNHHRNCLLCHAPADDLSDLEPKETPLTAQVLIPNEPFPVKYYNTPTPDILVRFDVTYLRQDFSIMMHVDDAHPWPRLQRFDFLVRTREVTAKEAQAVRELLKAENAGEPAPNQSAALHALRELTGLDAEPNAQAWRELLARN